MTEPLPLDLLIVEDSQDDAELMIRALHKHQLASRIQVLENGAEALDLLFGQGEYAGRGLARPPRVILLDLKLPKVDGLEVLHRIKSSERTKTIPVVIVTSSREYSDIQKAYLWGANGYVVKPIAFDEFSKAIIHLATFWLQVNEPPEARL
jgi:two-component system, response regulator